jgi:hypothetical protein
MFPDVRERLVEAGVGIPRNGTLTLFHAGPASKLDAIEAALEIPASIEADRKLRVYLASAPEIAEVIPHADGAVAVEVDVELDLELGMGVSQEWVELVYEIPEGQTGMPVYSATRVRRV